MSNSNIFFRSEELGFFDGINAEAQRLTAPRAKYFLKILPPVTQDKPVLERESLYGEQKRNWGYAGPILMPLYVTTPEEPKEFEENRGGNEDINAIAFVSRKLFEDSIPAEIVPKILSVRGVLVPDSGDVVAVWTTHQGDVAFWDVESVERDSYLGDLPLHLQWRLTLQRRSRYAAERSFGPTLTPAEPLVILDAAEFDTITRNIQPRPEKPEDGRVVQADLEKRALNL